MTSENIPASPLPTSILDDFLEATFDASDADIEGAQQKEKEEFVAVCAELEEAFPETGLRFTEGFRGAMPMTAYGWILGRRFYFRFRADTASMTVGNVDPVKAGIEFERRIAMHARHKYQLARWDSTGSEDSRAIAVDEITAEMREAVIDHYDLAVETDFSAAAFPNDVSQRVSVPEYTGQEWNGILTPAQAKDVFAQLVQKLNK
jgi:hypothetical protein